MRWVELISVLGSNIFAHKVACVVLPSAEARMPESQQVKPEACTVCKEANEERSTG